MTLPRGVVDLAPTCRRRTCGWSPDRDAGGARIAASGADAAVPAGRAAGAWRAGWFTAQGRLSERRQHRTADLAPRPSASTAAACRGCSATCRSGARTWSTACGSRWADHRGADAAVAHRAAAVRFRIRSRVFRWYAQLRAVEERRQAASRPTSCCASSTHIEQRVGRVQVPLSYADELYALRSHIQMVRRRLTAA